MFGFGRKRKEPPPQPKDVPEFVDVVGAKIAEMNRLQAAELPYKRDGSHIATNAILGHRQSEIQRELLHEYGETPVIDRKTGRWKLCARHIVARKK